MKTKNFLSILAFGIIVSAFGQKPTMELTFTAEYYGQYVPLDSIFIENLTQGGDTTLYAPDTILVLNYIISIDDNEAIGENTFFLSQNYPNPFKEKTIVNLHLQEKEHIKITIRDIVGRQVAQYENTLNHGSHSFDFYSGNEKFYLFNVTGKYASQTIKMLNSNPTFGGKCKIVYNKYQDNMIGYKSHEAINNFVFNLGDELRYIGYAKTVNEVNGSDVIENTPQTNENYLFEITEGIPCPGIPFVVHEGQVYNTVLIGNQCWLKENLNVGTMINGSNNQTNNSTIEKYCYDNNSANCDEYGGLYQWDEMMQYTTQQGTQGICPNGWHLPNDDEWCTLTQYIDPTVNCNTTGWSGADCGYKIKSTSGWYSNGNGSNTYGFEALPGGYYRYYYGGFDTIEKSATFWSSTENGSDAWYWTFYYGHDGVYRNYGNYEDYGFSVRCVQD
ncbi:MAG: T9SS type A sorting domain-containing protein [Bacteroidales bacterium]|nr:T9SS type A sorting domain-containing protein [Bacteroidales bacterium]